MRDYELMLVISPDLTDENIPGVEERIKQAIGNHGGEVTEVLDAAPWGRRRLAYPIGAFRDGYYVIMQLKLSPEQTTTLERDLQLTEEVMRYLLVRKS
ncbi:MAG: 30S ribosomal protein S6 [Chloroflexi bacterium]|nr:30S ribosomal protein S6 [Chloroflexota bacterium]